MQQEIRAGDGWKQYIQQFEKLKDLWDNMPEVTALWLAQQIDIFAKVYPPQPALILPWVNAITRTPAHDGVVHLKIGTLNRVGNFFDNGLGKGVYIQGHEPWTLGEEKFDGVFWLDEQPVEQKENEAAFTEADANFMRECDIYPKADGGATIITENDEGAHIDADELRKLSEILNRYANQKQNKQ